MINRPLPRQGGNTTATNTHNDCPSAPHIVVVGSSFIDYVAYVERNPAPGETIHSHNFQKGFGGKGANQAVAAALLGSKVRMVSAIGGQNDGDAANYIRNFAEVGVDTSSVIRVDKEATGLAMICVYTKTGQNQIVICPNATTKFLPETLSLKKTLPARVTGSCNVKKNILICQNEIPLETTLAAIKYAMTGDRSGQYYTILNTAPAPSQEDFKKILPYLKYVSLICPNETEASLMTGVDVTDVQSAMKACEVLKKLGVANVVITLGKMGYIVSTSAVADTMSGEPREVITKHFSATKVKNIVDTTGAGDCFVGSVAHFLLKGESLVKACEAANVCAGISVTRKGTQASYPRKHELPQTYMSVISKY